MSIAGPQPLEVALSAYQTLFGENLRNLLARRITAADIDELRHAKHQLLCVLADVPDDEPAPLAFICTAEGWHRARWEVRSGVVLCPVCKLGSLRPLGFWDVAEVLERLPLWQEVLRRATGKEG